MLSRAAAMRSSSTAPCFSICVPSSRIAASLPVRLAAFSSASRAITPCSAENCARS
jgi:hypothetical protein